jgi:hypothetical protein
MSATIIQGMSKRYEGNFQLNGVNIPGGTLEEITAFYNASEGPGSLEVKGNDLVYHPPEYGVRPLEAVTSTRPPNRKERRAGRAGRKV